MKKQLELKRWIESNLLIPNGLDWNSKVTAYYHDGRNVSTYALHEVWIKFLDERIEWLEYFFNTLCKDGFVNTRFAKYAIDPKEQSTKPTKHLVKNGRRIVGFVYQNTKGEFWYAFGKPSQAQFISFACNSVEHGKACIEMSARLTH